MAELGNGAWGNGSRLGGRTADPGPGLRKRKTQRRDSGDRQEGDSRDPEGSRRHEARTGAQRSRESSRKIITRKRPGIRGPGAGSQGAKGVAEALASVGSWRRPHSVRAVGGSGRPSPRAQTLGAANRGKSGRTRFSSQPLRSLGRSRVVGAWLRPGQMAAVRATGPKLDSPSD